MTDSVIETKNIHKQFGTNIVLDGLDMDVKKGETFAFLGRNGAGKTTTIKSLMGLVKPDSGSISVLGNDPAIDPIQVRSTVGYLAEDQTMFGWMRVEQLIRFIAPFYPTWDHQLAQQYVTQFDLPLRTKVKHLSKGQTVRVGLLLALAHRPELVVLDDPALGLDPIMRRDFNRDLVTHLQAEGRTVLYSSHLLYEVEPIADIIAILHEGKIVRQAPTEELRAQVKRISIDTAAVAKIGSKLKILDGRVSAGEVNLTVDDAVNAIELLQRAGIEHRTVDLNLDEIFEAFVAGQREIRFDFPEVEIANQPV
ncbi:ABC transporter ATP-binding protein [Thalassoglobus polymorphus]|uniref:Putative ABC transporter ATP-binding protein YbhF n=1 Tax=Thalassoglobus polymorphus TaxID=2527994 RepID=A0A517QRN6_9PLAN|nr:ABC transporter ATP-binding protein [Thalassoglobus polymorphus]QDT34281.1 putative ABC transporter ATP-binding protein YbhF [Thalassoglobus polymorphus]